MSCFTTKVKCSTIRGCLLITDHQQESDLRPLRQFSLNHDPPNCVNFHWQEKARNLRENTEIYLYFVRVGILAGLLVISFF